ncbi:MAG: S1 RNA-binding domain-containing protein [Ferruginibacter sp.]
MATESIMGTVTFINHDKDYATIEYTLNGKKKTINGNISEREQLKLKSEKIIKKIHNFHVGDEVTFIINLSARGDKMIADCIEFKFNNALDNLIHKSAIENRFVGYLKRVGDDYFVKETGSYIFFPLKFSPWEIKPGDNNLNEPFFFKLENTDKPGKATAAPFKSLYIPEYTAILKYFKNKTPVDATVYKISPHGVFVNILGNKIQAKIPVSKNNETPAGTQLKIGDVVKVIISYPGTSRIIIERV